MRPFYFCSVVILLLFGISDAFFFSLNSGAVFGSDLSTPKEKSLLLIGQGEQRLLRLPGLQKYSIGSPIVRTVWIKHPFENSTQSLGESLLLKGISPGNTDLWVWKQDGSTEHRTVRVEKWNIDQLSPLLKKALSQLDEIEVLFSGEGVILRGEFNSLEESAKIAALMDGFPNKIFNQSQPSEELLHNRQISLEKWLKSSSMTSSLRLERIGKSLWIRGHIDRPTERVAIEKQAKSVFPLIHLEIESLPDHAPTVYFRVFLLELKRSQFRSLGLSWPPYSTVFQVTSGGVQDLIQMDLTLQQLEGNGNAKILSNPELVVRAPGEAELFAGGEIPIRLQTKFFANVTWKNYGLLLRLKVTHTAGEKVRLDISTEVSHLDYTTSQENIPGIQSNKMKTQVDARFGSPLFLSGLLQQGVREEARGLPFLRSLPILGLLFGSEDYLNERSELVAILYPHANPPVAPMEKFPSTLTPHGSAPFPRNWLSPKEEQELKQSEDYPWNALD